MSAIYNTNNHGFTLIELLVVMAIVSILAAIAVPQFSAFRTRGFDNRALMDLRGIAIAEEGYFLDHEEYLDCQDQECSQLPGIAALSKGVKIKVQSTTDNFTAAAHHQKGSGRIYVWDSSKGGLLE